MRNSPLGLANSLRGMGTGRQSSLWAQLPQLAMPVRVLVMGTAQTPSLDAVLALSLRDRVLAQLRSV